jgi:hypothetical protein
MPPYCFTEEKFDRLAEKEIVFVRAAEFAAVCKHLGSYIRIEFVTI